MQLYSLSEYSYDLPEELIAAHPERKRDASRLMRINRANGSISHGRFKDLSNTLSENDVLVINNTRVIPGRLLGKKETGGKVEALILDYDPQKVRAAADHKKGYVAQCLIKSSKPPKTGQSFYFDASITAEVLSYDSGKAKLKFTCDGDFDDLLERAGKIPLPPYIKRDNVPEDRASYQTIYAAEKGAVAAPTAGLHFTDSLLGELKGRGVEIAQITLHVGYGTFIPIRSGDIREHVMHGERYHIDETAAGTVNKAVRDKKRVVAVGTTSVRTLEYVSDEDGCIHPGNGVCDLYIYPGYRFKSVGAMITNFHLPESSLILLVSAFYSRDGILSAYGEAVLNRYRFFSYGDAMFIE